MNATQEQQQVIDIMRETVDKPAERERRLKQMARDNVLCPGVICKCGPGVTSCPRHGKVINP